MVVPQREVRRLVGLGARDHFDSRVGACGKYPMASVARLTLFVYSVIFVYMAGIVHARLDPETEELLERLKRQRGWNESEVVRRGIRVLARSELKARGARRIIGLGKFSSGVEDLGSDKRHLEGFGR